MKDAHSQLDKDFKDAQNRAATTDRQFPPDLKLHFYAYYKRAMGDNVAHGLEASDRSKLIGAFKMNALFQIKNLDQDDAKRKYIALVDKYIPKS